MPAPAGVAKIEKIPGEIQSSGLSPPTEEPGHGEEHHCSDGRDEKTPDVESGNPRLAEMIEDHTAEHAADNSDEDVEEATAPFTDTSDAFRQPACDASEDNPTEYAHDPPFHNDAMPRPDTGIRLRHEDITWDIPEKHVVHIG
jgi:hypothetical protein